MNADQQPTAFQVIAAILASVPAEISYSGSDTWKIESQRDFRSPEADGGEPFAIELKLKGFSEPYVIVVASEKDFLPSERMAAQGYEYRELYVETAEEEL